MTDVEPELYGPAGDASHHLSGEQLTAGWRALPPADPNLGHLKLIVYRRPDGVRETPERTMLTPEHGVPGDRWGRRSPRNPNAQMTVMRHDIAQLIANGQPLTLFGDNLFVDFDISAANLPFGTRILLGEAVVEMSPMPHNGCVKFKARFGEEAHRFVNAASTRNQNLRGIYWKVIQPGEISVGAPIRIIERATEPSAPSP